MSAKDKTYRKTVACNWAAFRNAECAVAFMTIQNNSTMTLLEFVSEAVNAKAMPILKKAKIAPYPRAK